MSAREQLLGLIRPYLTGHGHGDASAETVLNIYRDEVAHGLAEKIRQAIPDIMDREQGYLHQDMLTELADLIDPKTP